ncbi:GAS2-like protein pickled eggs, partial [Fragariocoptes setiger]
MSVDSANAAGVLSPYANTAEEYSAKIVKLQQAYLTPLKEDLADWLNKILNVDYITANNFMDKLDNGVIVCKLAKIISNWCNENHPINISAVDTKRCLDNTSSIQNSASPSSSGYSTNHQHLGVTTATTTSSLTSPSNLSANSSSNSYSSTPTRKLSKSANFLVAPMQAKIWEDAKCRTFYARDNVCNFIKWTRELGVNQSVIFETDDLVLHGNARQVVLCLLDVARIACVRYGFVEVPGLVKFEQEIDLELALEADNEAAAAIAHLNATQIHEHHGVVSEDLINKESGRRNSRLNRSSGEAAAATEELVCTWQKRQADRSGSQNSERNTYPNIDCDKISVCNRQQNLVENIDTTDNNCRTLDPHQGNLAENGEILSHSDCDSSRAASSSPSSVSKRKLRTNVSGIPTRTPTRTPPGANVRDQSPLLLASSTLAACRPLDHPMDGDESVASETDDASSDISMCATPSSGATTTAKGASDLDGRVMRIAKSYYGKQVRRGVQRLSEGKYKIAERIVFVRLLKGQHVMVRIGGGWDTLQNFLFRHKSDPSQVIDVDDLLPLDAKVVSSSSDNKSSSGGTPSRHPSSNSPVVMSASHQSAATPSHEGPFFRVHDIEAAASSMESAWSHNYYHHHHNQQHRSPAQLSHTQLSQSSHSGTTAQLNSCNNSHSNNNSQAILTIARQPDDLLDTSGSSSLNSSGAVLTIADTDITQSCTELAGAVTPSDWSPVRTDAVVIGVSGDTTKPTLLSSSILVAPVVTTTTTTAKTFERRSSANGPVTSSSGVTTSNSASSTASSSASSGFDSATSSLRTHTSSSSQQVSPARRQDDLPIQSRATRSRSSSVDERDEIGTDESSASTDDTSSCTVDSSLATSATPTMIKMSPARLIKTAVGTAATNKPLSTCYRRDDGS